MVSVGLGLGFGLAGIQRRALAAEPSGWIALPRGREIGLVAADGLTSRPIVSLAPGEFIADVALSPDGTRVAFGMFTARTGDGPGGSDIVIAPVANGTERTIVVPRDRPGMLLAAPQWSPDGQSLLFDSVGLTATGQAGVTAEWIAVDGTGRRTVAQSARYPSFAPDGKSAIYTRALPTGDALWEQPLDGSPGREIIPEGKFLVVVYPRYRPDGQEIAFGGVGDALPTYPLPPGFGAPGSTGAPAVPAAPGAPGVPGAPMAPGGPGPSMQPGSAPGPGSAPASLPKLQLGEGAADPIRPRTVLAHGFPGEPYVVNPDGSDARRLAELPIDDAAVAWSPDSRWLAISGASGLFLVNPTDGEVRRLDEFGSFGAIDWR